MQRVFELVDTIGLPPGVLNLVNGTKTAVNVLLEHPEVRAISFVGSTPVARHIYAHAAEYGKRVQCQGGAKNHVVVLPDADMDMSAQVIAESAFGCAGQRCLAVSVAVTVGDAQKRFRDSVVDRARSLRVGYGLEDRTEMGPVITAESKQRIESLIAAGVSDGAKAIVDGRSPQIHDYEDGNFVSPTVLDGLPVESKVASTEIFGPVLSLVHADTVDEAIQFLSRTAYGNAASIFTTSGAAARKFRYEAPAGNIGVNIGVARSHGLFSVQWMGRQFLRNGACTGSRRDRILYRQESCDRALDAEFEPEVLAVNPLSAVAEVGAKTTEEKYREYLMTGFVKAVTPVVIDHAEGATVTDVNGRTYLDCFAGISVVNAGHCNPEVIAAAKAQIDKLVHCCSYMYHVPAVADMAEKMAEITPGRLKKTFFANSGAEAVEGALKLARLYTGKKEVISLEASFHGRTYATLSVTGNSSRKKRGGPYASGVAFAPAPYTYRSQWESDERCAEECAKAVEHVVRFHTSGDVAAFLAEPVMGEGGIIVPPRNYFKAVKEVLDSHGILFDCRRSAVRLRAYRRDVWH